MADLLLELFSEEIPARMQAQAAKDLERLVVGALSDRGLMFEGARSFAGPRRLTLSVIGLPAKQPDVSEERKGPRVGAPEKAIDGFLRSAGVTLEQCQKQSDAKGEFYVAVIARKGRATAEVIAEIVPEAMAKLPWPKSMRWGTGGDVRWVRPLAFDPLHLRRRSGAVRIRGRQKRQHHARSPLSVGRQADRWCAISTITRPR